MLSKKTFVSCTLAAVTGLAFHFCQPVSAQVDAIDQFANPLPESGRWFTNDGSLTGFFIEIQNGILAGLYVGGDADGDNVWLNFSGVLQPGATTDVEGVWILEADLLRVSGAGCIIDCTDDESPERAFVDAGDIRLEFRGRSEGRVWVNDQPVREITPIYFGVERTEINPVAPPVFLPNLEGKWVVARAPLEGFPDSYNGTGIIEIGPRTATDFSFVMPPPPVPDTLYSNAIVSDSAGIFPAGSTIDCQTFEDPLVEPVCQIVFGVGPMVSFSIDFESMTDARVNVIQEFDVPGNPVQLQLFKLNYD